MTNDLVYSVDDSENRHLKYLDDNPW